MFENIKNISPRAFTLKSRTRLKALKSEVKISSTTYKKEGNLPTFRMYYAIWDTGATGSVITKRVADECGLKPYSMIKCHTASGIMTTPVYYVDMILPNDIVAAFIPVSEGLLSPDIDVLIGMDIISHGDFAVTNKDGETMFSFMTPSREHIDFTDHLK